MSRSTLTPADRRVLGSLPRDGSWLIVAQKMQRALNALVLRRGGLVEVAQGNFGARGADRVRCRLTVEGMKIVSTSTLSRVAAP